VKLLSSPAGEPLPGCEHCFTEKGLKALLGSSEVWRDLGPQGSARKSPEEIGAELFRALISGEIRSLWDRSLEAVRPGRGLPILLRLGAVPELEGWPWELLYDPSRDRFLSLSRKTSVVRYLENPTAPDPKRVALPLKILVVIANPADCDPIDGEGEWERLNRALEGLRTKGKVLIKRLIPPTLAALDEAMSQSWNIVHFVGHGRFAHGEGRLILEDGAGRQDDVSGRKLKELLEERQRDLRLVVLNACVGAKTSPENVFAGVAQSLVRAGVPAVVAMRNRVSDRAALTFAAGFYGALAKALAVNAAVGAARRAMRSASDDLEWSTPVLYMRSPVEIEGHRWRALLAAVLGAMLLGGGGYWLSTKPDRSPDPACPSPPGLDVSFVNIEPGQFSMGTKGRQVKITHPYCLGKFEVTQGEWKKIMGTPYKQAKEGDNLPVGNVSWNDAEMFLSRLAAKEPTSHYRLPTEAQWEYAARAGTSSRFSFGKALSDLHVYGNCSQSGQPTPGGTFLHNPWGLYDMYGNVSEWVADWTGPLPNEPARDPAGPLTGTEKVRRGGSFRYSVHCDSAYRTSSKPEHRKDDIGFRIVRDPTP
jgi:formylglycine-generating enzyme required for sulfatase activity